MQPQEEGQAPARQPPPFADSTAAKIFRFTYDGPARLLKAYLLERYAYNRDAAWREGFYPERVRRNGEAVNDATPVLPGDRLAYLHLRREEPPAPTLGPPLYEDEWMAVWHKPDCIPVDPSGVYYFSCLALLLREQRGEIGLMPAHRLDLETAGPVIFAKRKSDVKHFHRLFRDQSVRKCYRALVHGKFPTNLREISGWIVPAAGSAISTKLALAEGCGAEDARDRGWSITRIAGVVHRPPFSELLLHPLTGKTNQLRVHLAAVGHPIVGDKKYHADESVFLDWLAHGDFEGLRNRLLLPRQALLCEALEFTHPFTVIRLRIDAPEGSWKEKIRGLVEPSSSDRRWWADLLS